MHKTFAFRLFPTKGQTRQLQATLDECRWLYNLFLAERKTAWAEQQTSISLYAQMKPLPALKKERPSLTRVHSQVLQNVAVRVDLAFKAFFRRAKAGKTPGYPRFRGQNRYDSFCYPQTGWYIDAEQQVVRLAKIGAVRATIHRSVLGRIKTCCVRRAATGKWYVYFACEDVPADTLPNSEEHLGLDVGLTNFATLSTGEVIPNPHFFRRDEHALARAQRRLGKEPPGSQHREKRRRVVARIHERIAHRRGNFAHQESRKIVNRAALIAVEDLSINRMMHNHCLAKSIGDASWSQFARDLTYKAASAGRRLAHVNPAYTSQTCSTCGHRQPIALADRTYHCPCCGLSLDRDHNASLVILALGQQSLGTALEAPDS